MKQIKTLTINGNSYEITDSNAAHIDDSAVGANAWSGAKIHRELSALTQDQQDTAEAVEALTSANAQQDAQLAALAQAVSAAPKQYELIETITLTEEATAISRDKDPEGNAYNFSALSVYIETPAVAEAKTLTIGCRHSDGNLGYFNASKGLNTSENATFFRIYNDRGLVEQYYGSGSRANSSTLCKQPRYQNTKWENLTKISLGASTGTFPIGTTVTIKAIRG